MIKEGKTIVRITVSVVNLGEIHKTYIILLFFDTVFNNKDYANSSVVGEG
jgi:hypothetical protein